MAYCFPAARNNLPRALYPAPRTATERVTLLATVLLLLLLCSTAPANCEDTQVLAFLGQTPFRVYISRATPPFTQLYQLFAINPEDGSSLDITYRLVEGATYESIQLYHVYPPTGVLTNFEFLPQNGPLQYDLVVEAGLGEQTAIANVSVIVVPESDTTPRFEHSQYDVSISEGLAVDYPFTVVRAFSLDPSTSTHHYSIVSGDTGGDIAISSDTGVLRVNRALDREKTDSYSLTVRYVEDTTSIDVAVEIIILDENDHAPLFSNVLYNVTRNEDLSLETIVVTVTATDPDADQNGRVSYSLHPSVNSTFSLDQLTGEIRTIASLDYERQLQYQFTVTAYDSGKPRLSSVATVLVNLVNIDDECPRFQNPVYIQELPYDPLNNLLPTPGMEVLTVVASDPDKFSNVTYTIVSGNGDHLFSLDSTTGVITLDVVDPDPRGQYDLAISASDHSCINQSFARVEIGIGNVNDHSPEFQTVCLAEVRENPPLGTEVVVLEASDNDIGVNGLITYSLLTSKALFIINPSNGVVRTNATPEMYDRETTATFQVGVTATDGGNRQDYCLLTITLTDENDNCPTFTVDQYNTTIALGSSTATFVVQVQANDVDLGSNGSIIYSLSSPTDLPFEIDPQTGRIVTNGALNHTTDFYLFTAIATDQGIEPLSSAVLVNVTLANGGSFPMFNQSSYSATICENSPFTTPVVEVTATTTVPGLVLYSMHRGTDYASNQDLIFDVYDQTGVVYVGSNALVDYERLPAGKFNLLVQALNSAGSSLATVEVNIIDQDDNPPQFTSNEITATITENEPSGTTLIQLQAIDPDSGTNGEIQYRLRDSAECFTVSSEGIMTSKAEFDADQEIAEADRLNVYVEAYNPNPAEMDSECNAIPRRTDTVLVRVTVKDLNDNPPRFEQTSYNVTIPENQPIQSSLWTFEAIDIDSSDRGRLTYSILPGMNDGTFEMDPSGILILSRRVDFETKTFYDFDIQVTDGMFTDNATVTVRVSNVDDEPPVFRESLYLGQVVENAPMGTSILTVETFDPDSDIVIYELTGLAEGRFAVNEMGEVTVAGPVDREEFSGGLVVFLAFAEGGSLATTEISINISDVNDYTPRFSEPFRGRVEENTAVSSGAGEEDNEGTFVGKVQAVDLDEGRNGTVKYSLLSGEEHGFRIDPDSGTITAHAEFDREALLSYTLVVQATDTGIPEKLSSTTEVVIEIGDVNDNKPFFPYPYMYVRIFEDCASGTHVFSVPAEDLDNGTNATVTYSLVSMEPAEAKFSLDPLSGEVTVSGSLDYEIPLHRNYRLILSLKDPLFESETDGVLEIDLLDRNDNPPVIQNLVYPLGSNIQENIPVGTVLAQFEVSDLDSGINGQLEVEIIQGNTNGDLVVSLEDNGAVEIRSARELDKETTPGYSLTLVVSDRGISVNSASTTVQFTVADVNDVPPIFSEDPYLAAVLEGTPAQNSIIQVLATDPDTGGGGTVALYRVISGHEGRFGLDPMTGILETLVTFDREEQDEYILTIVAVDAGSDPLTGTATVIVTITDVNDIPSSDGGHLDILIYALDGLLPAGDIAPVYFADPDTSNNFIDCQRLSSSEGNPFVVNESRCVVQLLQGDPPVGTYDLEVLGSDGINSPVSSTVQIVVEHLTSDLLPPDNTLTITLKNSVSSFLDSDWQTFPGLLAAALGVTEDRVTVVSVHAGYYDQENTVDVTFSARDSQGVFLNPTALLQDLYLNREILSSGNSSLYALPTDLCSLEPCSNQAACATVRNFLATQLVARSTQFVLLAPVVQLDYECKCEEGTAGELCEINFNDCYSDPCFYNAPCSDDVQGFQCVCPEGTAGSDCSFNPDECISNPCQNGATCKNGLGVHICECLPGYYGTECQYQYFRVSSICTPDPCLNGGECSSGRDSYTCLCPQGHSGLHCEEEELIQGGCIGNPCYNGSTCMDTQFGPDCTCSVGYTGPFCRWPLNNCELQPCRNGGTCIPGYYGSYQCLCNTSYTGEDCSTLVPPCESDPCQNGGRCHSVTEDAAAYECECTREYQGENCETPIVPPQDLCSPNPCMDGSNCTSDLDSYTCTCPDTSPTTSCVCNPCQHGGTCSTTSSSSSSSFYTCSCSLGFTGSNCETNVDECASGPCQNGASCTDGINGFICRCPSDHITGSLCDVHCPSGHSGDFCQITPTYCNENACLNDGTCIEETAGFSCTCLASFTGTTCESENNCANEVCLNGGMCTDVTTGGVKCLCKPGFNGPNCELRVVSFNGSEVLSSFRAYDSLDLRRRGSISFQFATRDSNGLLLYNTQFQEGASRDFILAEVTGGYLRVGVSHGGKEEAGLEIVSTRGTVNDGQWHTVTIDTVGKVRR